jgi:para-aminobenzoate synthetase/4-amino-4-deoxychorismate lyase
MFERALIRNHDTNNWSLLTGYVDVLVAEKHGEVLEVIETAELRAQAEQLHAAGYVAYEASHAFDSKFPKRDIDIPLVCFALFTAETTLDSLADLYAPADASPDHWQLTESQQSFESKVSRIREMIGAGEVYQINLTSRMRQSEVVTLADFARWSQDMPYAVYLEGPELSLCSASPELFFQREGGVVWSKPMKGTVGRRSEATADESSALWLQQSRKNRAENVMITDMVRNDLARISSTGKVSVDELFGVERYPSVWQMTSTVKSEVDASVAEIFRALFPAASITGAPKRAALEVIDDLEEEPREIYTGAVGRIKPSGAACFNVAIRTAWSSTVTGDSRFGSGCGIVWDSDPTEEFEELKTKARILRQPDPQFHLFETMGIVNGEIPRLSRHLFRLANSAQYWSFDFDAEAAKRYLDDVVKQVVNGHENDGLSASTFRLRLQLDRHGALSHRVETIELSPMQSPQSKAALHSGERPMVELALVQTAVVVDDTFLTHKTSRREAYDRAVDEVPEGCEPVMFNTLGNVTESAIANIVYQMNGELFTPPLADGLLPGVLRGELLDKGVITERTLPVVDLKSVEAFWLINSLRGWRKATLAENKV